jgi:hypothetical protein
VKTILRWLIFFSVGLGLSGCQSPSLSLTPTLTPKEVAFATAVPIVEMNTKMKLRLATELANASKVNSVISLILENYSRKSIGFSGYYGLSTYVYSDTTNSWVALKDGSTYPNKNTVLDPKDGDFSVQVVRAFPIVPNDGKSVTVRILVVGKVHQNGAPTDQEVGAYVDAVLNP